jgi:H+-translocating NAD(P) transhydrogenase subunit alpha
MEFFHNNLLMFYLLAFAILLGIEVISKVPAVLHTPLMSGANAIHGVVLVGAIIVLFNARHDDWVSLGVGFVAVIFGTLNVVGGFAVTDRMLEMFKKKKK